MTEAHGNDERHEGLYETCEEMVKMAVLRLGEGDMCVSCSLVGIATAAMKLHFCGLMQSGELPMEEVDGIMRAVLEKVANDAHAMAIAKYGADA